MILPKRAREAWIDAMRETHGPLLLMVGYDDCIIGVCHRVSAKPCFLYDRAMVLRRLQKQGMTAEEASEFHEFNQAGCYLGEYTPGFIERP